MADTTNNVVDIATAKGGNVTETKNKTTSKKATSKKAPRKKRATRKASAAKKPSTEIGSFMWYDVDSCSITYTDLVALFDAEKLDHKYLPADQVKPENALKKVKQKVNGRRQSLAVMMEEINLNDDRVLYGVVDPTVDRSKEELQYHHAVTVELNRSSGNLTITNRTKGADPHAKVGNTTCKEIIELIESMYAEFGGHLISRDITRMVVRALKMMSMVSLRRGGGAYWVAPQHKDDLQALARVFNQVSKLPMSVMTLTDTNGNRNTVVERAKEQTRDKIESLTKKLSGFQERVNLGTITPKSLETKTAEFIALRAEVKLFADALNFKAEDLLSGITKAEKSVRGMIEKLGQDKDEKENKKAAANG